MTLAQSARRCPRDAQEDEEADEPRGVTFNDAVLDERRRGQVHNGIYHDAPKELGHLHVSIMRDESARALPYCGYLEDLDPERADVIICVLIGCSRAR